MYTDLFQPIVVAMEVMSPVARYLKFIVGADLLSKFQCNVTAVHPTCCESHVYRSVKGARKFAGALEQRWISPFHPSIL